MPPPLDAAATPKRIQRKRTKGWKMPENTIYVGRPTRWGNEFEVTNGVTRKEAVDRFVLHLASYFGWVEREVRRAFHPWPVQSSELREWIAPLRGKNLACWCPLDQPCHADVLLRLAALDAARVVKSAEPSNAQTSDGSLPDRAD